MLDAADAAFSAVIVQAVPAGGLAEGFLGRDTRRTGKEEGLHRLVLGQGDVPLLDGFAQRATVYGGQVGVKQAATGQFTQDAEDATGTVHVFHVVLLDVRRHLAQLRHLARQGIDVAQVEVHLGFLGSG